MIFPFVSMISSVPERTATLPESVPAASTGEMASRKLRNRSQLEILTNRSHHPTGAYTNTVLLPVSIFFGFIFYHRTCHSLHSFPSNVRPQICTLTVSVFARPHTISQSIFICLGHPSTFIFQRPSSRTSICLTHSSDKFASSICVRHSFAKIKRPSICLISHPHQTLIMAMTISPTRPTRPPPKRTRRWMPAAHCNTRQLFIFASSLCRSFCPRSP